MGDLIRSSPHLEGALSDYFLVESTFAATRTADLHKAIDLSRDEAVSLWTLRQTIPLHSQAVDEFLARLRVLQADTSASSVLRSFGVDRTGKAFAVLPTLSGQVIGASAKRSVAEAERRFTSCLKIVESIHAAGLSCGDVCASSFFLTREGDLQFIGVMGSFGALLGDEDAMPPSDTIPFIAPEQFSGEISPQSDVFALGVLMYFLLTGSFPYGTGSSAAAGGAPQFDFGAIALPSRLVASCPQWADEVIMRCLQPDPRERFVSAGKIVEGITEARGKAFREAVLPSHMPKKEAVPVGKPQSGPVLRGPAVGASPQASAQPGVSHSVLAPLLKYRMVMAVIAVFVISVAVVNALMSRAPISGAPPHPQVPRPGLDAVDKQTDSLEDYVRHLDQFVRSDDPLAHVTLVENAVEASSNERRAAAERAVVERLRRLGMQRSAEQLRQWLRAVGTAAGEGGAVPQLPSNYEPLLKALNPNLPIEARESGLREAYVANSKNSLRVAAAVALDAADTSAFSALLSQLIGDALDLPDAASHSGMALILAHPDLGLVFGDDIVQRREEIPDSDVVWLLEVLAARNDFNLRPFASLAVERGLLSPIRQTFLSTIRDRQDIPAEVLNALVRASAGVLKAEDAGTLGRWYDIESEKLLLAFCADSTDPEVLRESFDVLAGKTLTIDPAKSMVEWIRKNQWDRRVELAHLVGVVSHLEKMPEERVKSAFAALEPFAKDQRLTGILLAAKDPVITREMVERFAVLLPLGVLLNLLDHPDTEVRMKVIRAMREIKEAGAITIIIDHYEREKNEQVRNAYRETFWFIQQRESKLP